VFDVLCAASFAALVLVVHDLGYVVHAPYWNDEAWVAVSIKAPLHSVPDLIASSPIGWDLLLRLIPTQHPQAPRLVPLGFAMLAVAVAYGYARTLPWPSVRVARTAACAAATGALLLPSALVRNDLKQYTCDACCVLLLLWIASRVERTWSTRAMVRLGVAGVVLFLFSNPAALAFLAIVASLALVALKRRDWDRLVVLACTVAVAAIPMGATYVGFYARGNYPGLRNWWASNYPPFDKGAGATWHWFWHLAPTWFSAVGLGPMYIALPLVCLGAWGLRRLGLPATGLAVPVLFLEVAVLASARYYPIFDTRTSHFLATSFAVTAAVGVVWLVLGIQHGRHHRTTWVRYVALASVVMLFVAVHVGAARQHSIPPEPTAADAHTITSGYRAGDVIVANANGTWVLAYYWPGGRVLTEPTADSAQAFQAGNTAAPTFYPLCTLPAGKEPNAACSTVPVMEVGLSAAAEHVRAGGRIWIYVIRLSQPVLTVAQTWGRDHGFVVSRGSSTPDTGILVLDRRAGPAGRRG
jgi:hypothetical protein